MCSCSLRHTLSLSQHGEYVSLQYLYLQSLVGTNACLNRQQVNIKLFIAYVTLVQHLPCSPLLPLLIPLDTHGKGDGS
jgi:hypothetical protein